MMEIQIVQDVDTEENEETADHSEEAGECYSYEHHDEQPDISSHFFPASSTIPKMNAQSETDFIQSYIQTTQQQSPAERNGLYSEEPMESGNISVSSHAEEMLQSSILGDGIQPHRPTITIIDDCEDEASLQRDDSVSKDLLKRFVIDAQGIHSSLPPIDVDSQLNSLLHTNREIVTSLSNVDMPNQGLAEGKQHQVMISTMMTAPTMSAGDQQNVTINIVGNTVGSMFPTMLETAPDVMESFDGDGKSAQDKGVRLDLMFEVVAELTTSDGQVSMREITTQTSPVEKESRKRKRKSFEEPLMTGGNTGAARTDSSGAQNRFSCTKCSLRFINAKTRDAHIRCHKDMTKNYHCYFCEFTSTQWTRMHQHLFLHGVEKPHKCEKCSFTCKNRSDLAAHMPVHSSIKQFSCPKCPRMFKHRRNVVAHLRSCSGVDESGNPQKINGVEKFVCNVCKRELSTKKNLDKHMEIHLDLKPYVCEECGHATRLKESLVMHKRLHTGEKPYKCDVCEYATPDKSSLRRHKRTHTNERPYKCPSCNYSCIQKHCLDTHVRRKHTGEQFVCGLCHYATHDRYGLNQHFKRHQNSDGTIVHEIQIVEQGKHGSVLNSTPHAAGTTYIGLPSGAVLKANSKDKESGNEAEKQHTSNPVILRIAPSSHVEQTKGQPEVAPSVRVLDQRALTSVSDGKAVEDGSTLDNHLSTSADPSSQQQGDQKKDKGEVSATVELGQLEATLLQQIQQPGDEIFIQDTGEIVIQRQDGHLLVIQRQEIEEDDDHVDTQEYLTTVAPSELSHSQPASAFQVENDSRGAAPSLEQTNAGPVGEINS